MVAVVAILTTLATKAAAHLMAAEQGTINVVGDSAFVVLSVPVSALHGFDDDQDGLLSMSELKAHQADLRAEIDRRLVVTDGEVVASTVVLDLALSPQHESVQDRADQLVTLKHASWGHVPTDLHLACDLFGSQASERALTITATRNREDGKPGDTEVAVLTPSAPSRALFRSRFAPSAPRVAVVLGALALLAALTGSVWRARRRPG